MGLDERVLVVPSSELDRVGRFQGFSAEVDLYLKELLVPGVASFRARRDVEEDPNFKQIIPYVVFRSHSLIFCYKRGRAQGESRLHHLRSLGVGGHVSEEDCDGGSTLDAYELALSREIQEEVDVRSEGHMTRVGLINDDSTPVGQVHLGVVHVYDLHSPSIKPREAGLVDPEFIDHADLPLYIDEFETWSQIFIRGYLHK
jgi:predicted NUDIX family phosphoesterase